MLLGMIFAEILFLFVKVLLHLGDLLLKVHLDRRWNLVLRFHLLLKLRFWLWHSGDLWGGSLRDLLLGWLAICLHFREAARSLGVHPVEVGGRGATLAMHNFFWTLVRSTWSVTKCFNWVSLKIVLCCYHLDIENIHIAFVVDVWVPYWTLPHGLVIILEILKFGGIFLWRLLRLEMPYH